MRLVRLLNKPEYLFRPGQIIQKIRFLCRKSNADDLQPVRLPWGDIIHVCTAEAIGKSVLTLGVHELAVSEVLWRLIDQGDTCVDVGANIGYMTILLANRAGMTGRVFSFEPHPLIFNKLLMNIERIDTKTRITALNNAIGAADTEAELVEPADFQRNEGTAAISSSCTAKRLRGISYRVSVRRLDSMFSGNENIGVVKIDVEGAETEVFRGAKCLLGSKAIRDIVWEESERFPSESSELLSHHGYHIYQFSKALFRLSFWNPFDRRQGKCGLPWETRNFLATQDRARALARLAPRGWRCLG